jgi:predicted NBD/HSP70 family sugar kinase
VTSAAVGIGGTEIARRSVSTGAAHVSPDDVADLVAAAVTELRTAAGRPVLGVGVSVPGSVDKRTRSVAVAPNLGWRDVPLGDLITERLGPEVAVRIGNDADLSVLAEHSRGNGRGCTDVVYLIGRIGVGAGLVVNGAPLLGRDGRAGEIGHNVVVSNGPECHCVKRGCLETFIGDLALLSLARREGPPTEEGVAAVFADARTGDPTALAAVVTVAERLGQAVGDLVNTLNPQRIILGGSLSGVLELARSEIEVALEYYAFDPGHPVELFLPHFGVDSALVGAAELAFVELLEDPFIGEPVAAT